MNLSKSGASLSIDHPGLCYVGRHRRRVTLGLPGTIASTLKIGVQGSVLDMAMSMREGRGR